MFLTKSLTELEQLTNPENIVMKEYDIIKMYLITRLQMDEDLTSFNKDQAIIKKDKAQLLLEEGISVRRVNTSIRMFKNYYNNEDIAETADNVFNLVINDLGSRYKPTYMNSEELVKNYIDSYLQMNKDKAAFKERQRIILDELKSEIYYTGFIPKVLNNAYSNIKLSISSYAALCGTRYNMYISNEMADFKNNLEYLMTDIFLQELKKRDILDTTKIWEGSNESKS